MSIEGASFFTGIGGFDLGFERVGIHTVIQCELDRQCRRLLAEKFPKAKRLVDVRAIASVIRRLRRGQPILNHAFWTSIIRLLKSASVFFGGFPCQDLSVAGARAGLAGERSGLWYVFRRLIALFRPRWVVLENVPGLLSSNGGADFDILLRGLEKLGYRWAYRVLDAQWFGVAQRRERVFIVASLGDASSAEVLFEPDSVCGDSPPSREEGESPAGTLTRRALDGSSPCGGDGRDGLLVAGTLQAHHQGRADKAWTGQLLAVPDGPDGAVSSKWSKGTGGPAGDECYNLVTDVAPTLEATCGDYSRVDEFAGVVTKPLAFHGSQDPNISGDVTHPCGTNRGKETCALTSLGVRRLTPRECERLQAFPDDWTAAFPDTVRYKMLGNAVNVKHAEWIGARLVAVAGNVVEVDV